MSDMLKYAFGYFNNNTSSNAQTNELVGQIIEIGNVKLKVNRLIAEGKYSNTMVSKVIQRKIIVTESSTMMAMVGTLGDPSYVSPISRVCKKNLGGPFTSPHVCLPS